ncbi:MAG: hypothetical protein IPJ34_27870 [Myxococcales bacterium]|nr:hypothetical protein [Myxococcales bacterium]
MGPRGRENLALLVEAAFRGREAPTSAAWLVDLSAVRKPHEIGAAIARAVGVRAPHSDQLPDAVTTALRIQPDGLLLLDRAEHVASLLPGVLSSASPRRAPPSAWVVASRVRLSGRTAEPIEVGPLSEDDAATLFALRARVEASHSTVRTICRALDGVPLALELAAARVDALGLDGVQHPPAPQGPPHRRRSHDGGHGRLVVRPARRTNSAPARAAPASGGDSRSGRARRCSGLPWPARSAPGAAPSRCSPATRSTSNPGS